MTGHSLSFTDALVCGVPVVHVRNGLVDVGRINRRGYLSWYFQPDRDTDGYSAEQLREIADWIKANEQPA